jgi:hypothetical protein
MRFIILLSVILSSLSKAFADSFCGKCSFTTDTIDGVISIDLIATLERFAYLS